MSPAVSRALDPLRFRPLLWMSLCALGGVAAGGAFSRWCGIETRADLRWTWPIFPALLAIFGAYQLRFHGLKRRALIALALFLAFAAGAARRIAPRDGDISRLARIPAQLDGPLRPTNLSLRGVVADYPKNNEFSTQFPLQCTAPYAGRVWISAPFGTRVEVGDRIRLDVELQPLAKPGNPGEREGFWRFIGQNCWCVGLKPTSFQKEGVDAAYSLARRIGVWRGALLAHYERQFRGAGDEKSLVWRPFPAASAQLLTAMVFGEGGLSRPLPRTLRDDFRAAGLSHVLVASGTQVAFLTVITLWLLGQAGFKHSKMLLVAVPILVLYALLAGGAASIWRATLGGFALIYALLLGRDIDGLSLWGGAILVLLALDPLAAWSLSFQLTFAATWGLLTLAPALSGLFKRRFGKSQWLDLAAFSLGAQGATMPISLFHFGTFSASGLGANFVAVPLAGLMVLTGLLGLIFAPVNWLNYFLTRGVSSVAHGFAVLPGAKLSGAPLGLPWLVLCYAVLLMAIVPLALDIEAIRGELQLKKQGLSRWLKSVRPHSVGAVLLLFGVGLFWLLYAPGNPNLRVTMLDVGQGECILIRTPSGHNILIDGGSLDGRERADVGAQVIVPALQNLGVSRLDLMILTHADADHCNGLAEVAREIPVLAFLDGPGAGNRRPDVSQTEYFQLRKLLAAQKIPILAPRAGQKWQLGAAQLQILAPILPLLGDTNDDGLVCRLAFGKNRVLFTADIEASAEARLLARGADLRCTVLKVAHHGSRTSSSAAFLRAARPALALISCGQFNRFGHPNLQTLRALQRAQVATFRTDLSGAIEVECDANSCRAATFR